MDLALLEDFLELAKEMNFSRAADLRNMSQPAFSRRIRSLEDAIGTPLVQRTSRSVALTPAGLAVHSRAVPLVRLVAEARSAALEAAGVAEHALSLAATHALSFTFVPRWLTQIAGPAGIGALNMMSDSQQQCERLMLGGTVNFFVCHWHASAGGGLPENQFTHRVIGQDRLVALTAPDISGNPRWNLDAWDAKVPHLAYGSASGLSRILEAHWKMHGRPPLVPRMSSLLAATNLEMAKEGQGVAWLPLSLAETAIAAGTLVRAGGAGSDIPVEIVVFRPRSRLSAHAEQFWKKIVLIDPA
ncbi:LysR family transcriptional regulator [Nitratireductor sp. ZSWI3]|uniref:LysR family transcriptional regulator n=1 Tax=Nitratireductor sp. ZSWI3 TaxID=2966359 RepID=UPI00214FA06F|nr:LysR family transcriptional regulator [Nitratireductor sp. ZSWI3]MCR4265098.1 LysR substrate-binding domain-containing protein [Nitratireductor sp. ZSWI3]